MIPKGNMWVRIFKVKIIFFLFFWKKKEHVFLCLLVTNLVGGVYDMLNTPLLVSQIGVLTKMGVIFQKFKGVKTQKHGLRKKKYAIKQVKKKD